MEQAKKVLGQVLIVTVSVLLALKIQEQMNRAKLAAPAPTAK